MINLATHMPSSTFQMMLPWRWHENDRVRREGSATLVDGAIACAVTRFFQESFAPVYEEGGDRWIDEAWPVRPAPYNRTVLDAERSAARFSAAGGAGIVLRFAGFYGPDAFLREMLGVVKRGWSPLPGPGAAYWSSLSHEDAAAAVVAALSGKTMKLLSRSQRMSNAKLKTASGWAPRWRSAREGLPAAVCALTL